jgi:hypothetical protein
MLYPDQIQATKEIVTWWSSCKQFHILNGPGGVGKSHLVDSLLGSLPLAKVLLLAPTHKALYNLRSKTHGEYEFRTVASALGIRPVDEGKGLKFKHVAISPIWGQVNLAVVDEAGMLDEEHLTLLCSIGIKILFVGHGSQLPPVKVNRSVHDKCISPVYLKGYSQSELYIPKRNVGDLWDFCNTVERKIYDISVEIPTKYDIHRNALEELIIESRDSFASGNTKFALWTNDNVTKYNTRVRELIHGKVFEKYIPGDLVITTATCISIDFMEHLTEKSLLENAVNKNVYKDIYTDTDCVVVHCQQVVVKLNKSLHLQCYKLLLDSKVEGRFNVFELIHRDDYKRIADYYEHIAWGYTTKSAKEKAYERRATILKCFAQVRYFYASTCHRLQGSSIENVIIGVTDIMKNSNRTERCKLDYVATSRAEKNIYRYKGL